MGCSKYKYCITMQSLSYYVSGKKCPADYSMKKSNSYWWLFHPNHIWVRYPLLIAQSVCEWSNSCEGDMIGFTCILKTKRNVTICRDSRPAKKKQTTKKKNKQGNKVGMIIYNPTFTLKIHRVVYNEQFCYPYLAFPAWVCMAVLPPYILLHS